MSARTILRDERHREEILQVLSRVREPRTVAQIGCHLQHVDMFELYAALQELKADGQVTHGTNFAGVQTWVLVPGARLLVRDELPGAAIAVALLVGLVALGCLALVVGVYAAKFSLAFVMAAFGL